MERIMEIGLHDRYVSEHVKMLALNFIVNSKENNYLLIKQL